MSTAASTVRKVDIVDLIRKRNTFPLLQLPAVRITMRIEVTPPAPSAKMARLESAARTKLNLYESVITSECERFSKRIEILQKQGKRQDAVRVAAEVNASVRNALKSAEGAAIQAVEMAKKLESHGDNLLTEARIKTAITVLFSGVTLAADAVALAGTMGTDAMAYLSIAKTLASLGIEINQQIKGEAQLRNDVMHGMRAYLNLRGSAVMQAARRFGLANLNGLPGFPALFHALATRISQAASDITKGKDKAAIAKELTNFTVKMISAQFHDVEQARQKYRNHLVKMRHSIDRASGAADKLQAAMKAAPGFKEGIKVGAACMHSKTTIRTMAAALDERVAFLDSIETMLKGLGLACDDRTVIEKLKALDKRTLLAEGVDLASDVQSIYSLCSAVAAIV